MDEDLTGFDRALALTLEAVEVLPRENVALTELTGRVAAAAASARVDVPSADISLRKGYAVRSSELAAVGPGAPALAQDLSSREAIAPQIGFGLWRAKPVFCLPGTPTANQATFLYHVLPALLKLAGYRFAGLPALMAELDEPRGFNGEQFLDAIGSGARAQIPVVVQ